MNISYELYKSFWAIGRTRNLTHAAELLRVSQPAVSAALKSLELQLGSTLCIRQARGVRLTIEGELLYAELDRAVGHIQAAEEQLRRLQNLSSGTVSISASDTVCSHLLMPIITGFRTAHPGIRISITNQTSAVSIDRVESGQADLAFVNAEVDPERFKAVRCLDMTAVLIGGSDYQALSHEVLDIQELSRYPMILLESISSGRQAMDRFFKAEGVVIEPVYELGSVDLQIEFVRNNHGLGLIPDELCGYLIDNESLVRIETRPPFPSSDLNLIHLAGMPLSRAADAFRTYVIDYLKLSD